MSRQPLRPVVGFMLAAVAAFALAACGQTSEGGGGGDPIVFGDAEVDMAPMQEDDPLRDYCQARGEAVCGWGFECFGGSGAMTTFGLTGPGLEECVSDQLDRCYADLSDRSDRGTLNFSEEGGAVCAMRLRDAPCLATPPGEWVAQWQQYVQQWCGGVARGLVVSGDACAIQADCGTLEDACVDGACQPIPAASLVQTCDGGPDLGLPVLDESCATGTCVKVDGGAICSASCAGGRGCGVGGVCLLAQTLGGAVRPYCALRCAREDDPTCLELACEPINEDGDDRICQP